ncbi:MAG: FeoA family protein [Gemmatimonadaceae bacterium]
MPVVLHCKFRLFHSPCPLRFVQRRTGPRPAPYVAPVAPRSPANTVLHFWKRRRPSASSSSLRFSCPDDCPLASCPIGFCALVVGLSCPVQEARRLRTLGVFEGARVGIVDTRSGILLDVRGSRLALDVSVARTILVRPLAA